jgi:hypothetical protein
MVAAISFLRKNGIRYPKDDSSLYHAMIEIAQKRLHENGLAAVLEQQVNQPK